MKNIHILPTDKPSRLYEGVNKELKFTDHLITNKRIFCQNIYITSDKEIKEGDYFYQSFDSIIHKCYKLTDNYVIAEKPSDYPKKICKKIILTTDQDLIKDGVQAIDDEFLEWFVENPSCEEIEVISERRNWKEINWITIYKIIIPKEVDMLELGQIIPKEESKPFKQMEQLTKVDWEKFKKSPFPSKKEPKQGTMSEAIKEVIKNQLNQTEELKQETLEEAVENWDYLSFEAGANWQAKQMYSEKEVWELLKNIWGAIGNLKSTEYRLIEPFEQYKK